jgi:hypothetical protein
MTVEGNDHGSKVSLGGQPTQRGDDLTVAAMDAIDAMRADAARVVAAMERTDAAMGAYRSAVIRERAALRGCPSRGVVTTFGRPTT